MKTSLLVASALILSLNLSGFAAEKGVEFTHGPILGRPGSDRMAVWARTSRPAAIYLMYGTEPGQLTSRTASVSTRVDHDLTGWVSIDGLRPRTKYFYEIVIDGAEGAAARRGGHFRTLPSAESCRDPLHNPRGLFNFSFEIGDCNRQDEGGGDRPQDLPTYRTMLSQIADQIDFAVLNGDFIYEARRDWPVERWRESVGVEPGHEPRIVRDAPNIVGAWENYKLYMDRAPAVMDWHRVVPSFFMFDDHEIVDDCSGAGTIGLRDRRAVFRDIGVQAWFDYLGWSNPLAIDGAVHFGRARLRAGSDVLTDPDADFTRLDMAAHSNLHVHWGGPHAGEQDKKWDKEGGDPDAGVYAIAQVLGPNQLRIKPAAKADSEAGYSIGRYAFGSMRLANCEIIFLDTRSQRDHPNLKRQDQPGLTMLGARQKTWLQDLMRRSDADFFFVISSVTLMLPHIVDVGEPGFENYHDSWSGLLAEREEMIKFWDSLGKPVFVLSGDLHNSCAVKVTDRVWEMASGPHNSANSKAGTEGDRPVNGVYDSYGRPCEIRWSYYILKDAKGGRRQPMYCVVQVNNVVENFMPDGSPAWVAYPRPQVTFSFRDGFTGRELYAESILAPPSTQPGTGK